MPRAAPDIAAEELVPAPRERVFAFLADLETHWELADRFVEVLHLEGPPGASTGGRVRMRGPLGLRRTAHTRVELAEAPGLLCGTARVGSRTLARVRWELYEIDGATRVRLSAHIKAASAVDRLALALGGRDWMERRFAAILETLAGRFFDPASFDAWQSSARSSPTLRESEQLIRVAPNNSPTPKPSTRTRAR
jgi:hypothetical protein